MNFPRRRLIHQPPLRCQPTHDRRPHAGHETGRNKTQQGKGKHARKVFKSNVKRASEGCKPADSRSLSVATSADESLPSRPDYLETKWLSEQRLRIRGLTPPARLSRSQILPATDCINHDHQRRYGSGVRFCSRFWLPTLRSGFPRYENPPIVCEEIRSKTLADRQLRRPFRIEFRQHSVTHS